MNEPFRIIWMEEDNRLQFSMKMQTASSSQDTENSISQLANEHLVLLFDSDARIGSGLLVRKENGILAVLTARHVILDLVITGEVHIVVPSCGWHSFEPLSLRIEPRHDLALLHLPEGLTSDSGLDWSLWSSEDAPTVNSMDNVLIAGFPAEWKGDVDLQARTILGVTALGIWSSTKGMVNRRILLDVLNSDSLRSYEGMSGGPVFSEDGRLIAVVTHQSLDITGRLYAAPVEQARNLIQPFVPPTDAPKDFSRQLGTCIIAVKFEDYIFHVIGLFEYFLSESQPEHPISNISRLIALAFTSESASPRFVINTEAIIYHSDNTQSSRLFEWKTELEILLSTTRIAPLEEDASSALSMAQAINIANNLLKVNSQT